MSSIATEHEDELVFLRALAVRAGREMLRAAEASSTAVEQKGPVDFVTEVDRALEAMLVEAISARHPDHGIVAEEGSAAAGAAGGYVWYIDPLDGTTNFIHRHPFFAVSLAAWRDGEAEWACVYAPALDELYTAVRGQGAWLERPTLGIAPRALRVSGRGKLAQALLATGFPYDRSAIARLNLRCCAEALARARGLRRAGSASIDLCWLAAGRLDGFWELTLAPWDVAAGALIAREAGAVVSDLAGGQDFLHGRRICAATPAIHGELLRMLEDAHAAPEAWPLGVPFDGPAPLHAFERGADLS